VVLKVFGLGQAAIK